MYLRTRDESGQDLAPWSARLAECPGNRSANRSAEERVSEDDFEAVLAVLAGPSPWQEYIRENLRVARQNLPRRPFRVVSGKEFARTMQALGFNDDIAHIPGVTDKRMGVITMQEHFGVSSRATFLGAALHETVHLVSHPAGRGRTPHSTAFNILEEGLLEGLVECVTRDILSTQCITLPRPGMLGHEQRVPVARELLRRLSVPLLARVLFAGDYQQFLMTMNTLYSPAGWMEIRGLTTANNPVRAIQRMNELRAVEERRRNEELRRRLNAIPRRGVNRLGEYSGSGGSYWRANEGLGQAPTPMPPQFRWGDKTFSDRIQMSFEKARIAARNNAAFSHLPDVRTVPIAVMALNDDGSRPVAGQREFEMFFSGSLLKVAAMYAAFQLRVAVNDLASTFNPATINTPDKVFEKISATFDKQIAGSVPRITSAPGVTLKMRVPKYNEVFQAAMVGRGWRLSFNGAGTDNFAGHLRKMIVGSHNDSARFCIRALGYSWINGLLQSAGFLNFGFPGSEGIWLAGDYSEQPTVPILSVNDGPVKQATTCFHMAWLFSLLHDKKLVKNTADPFTGLSGNDDMLRLLRDAVDDPGAPSLLKRVPHSFTVLQSKIGVGELKGGSCRITDQNRCVFSEGAILRRPPSGRKFVVVWQNLTSLRAHPSLVRDGLRRIVSIIQDTMDDYRP
jgi:hypothetical protein